MPEGASEMTAAPLSRPIFVVGCPRSGTTLVQCILSASATAFSLPETHFFSIVLPSLSARPGDVLTPVSARTALSLLEREARLELPGGTIERATEAAERGRLTGAGLFELVVDAFRPAGGSGELRVVEKTPQHYRHLAEIGALYSDALFVNVVRNPVDVVSSWLGTPFANARSVLGYADAWLEAVDRAAAYERERPARVRTVVYERLIAEPEPSVRALCAFLDLPYEPAMLSEFGREAARNVGKDETWKQDVRSGVLLNRTGIWRQRLSPGKAWLIAQRTRPAAERMGVLTPVPASAGAVAAALLAEAAARFQEGYAAGGLRAAARHAAATLRAVRPAPAPAYLPQPSLA